MAINEPQEMEGLSILMPKSDKMALASIAQRMGYASVGAVARLALSEFVRQRREIEVLSALADGETEAYLQRHPVR